MKRNLLLGLAALSAATSFAAVPADGCTYETKDGVTLSSVWCASSKINNEAYKEIFNNVIPGDYTRRCFAVDGVIYIPHGDKVTTGEGDAAVTTNPWNLVAIDLYTGEVISKKPMMLDGEQYQGLLAAQNCGVDAYGHAWVSAFNSGAEGTVLKVYTLNLETAELTLAGNAIEWPADEASSRARIDYMDIAGDVTGVEADGFYGAVGSATDLAYMFVREQGSDDWTPGIDGYVSWPTGEAKFYPESAAAWGDNGTFVFATGMTDMFYANGRSTLPSQYSCAGGQAETISTMAVANETAVPEKPGTTGAFEFDLAGVHYLAYGDTQGEGGAKTKISRMSENVDFEGMELMWDMPAGDAVYSELSNGGHAFRTMYPVYKTDANGKNGVYIVSFYSKTVLAVYLVAEEGFESGVADIVVDNNTDAPAEYFNLQGVKVNNPASGLYIVRQGNKVSKQLVK